MAAWDDADADAAVFDAKLNQRALIRPEVFQQLGRHQHLTVVGELDCIVQEIEQHLAQAGHVAPHPTGQRVPQVNDQFKAFFTGPQRLDVAGILDGCQQAERLVSSSSLSDSILEKSSTSLITPSS